MTLHPRRQVPPCLAAPMRSRQRQQRQRQRRLAQTASRRPAAASSWTNYGPRWELPGKQGPRRRRLSPSPWPLPKTYTSCDAGASPADASLRGTLRVADPSSPRLPHRLLRRRRIVGILLSVLTACIVSGAVAVGVVLVLSARNYTGVLATAGTFAGAGALIACVEMYQHLSCYTRPTLQKQLLRVLLMVPVYASASFISLAFPKAAPYVDVIREMYEALTIYAFTWFVMTWLELDANLSFSSWPEMLASKPPIPHLWPLDQCFAPWPMGTPFIRAVQTGVLNYVVTRPVTAVIGFILTPLGKYNPGSLRPDNAYVYLATVNGLSQMWALYCMVMLYRVAWQDMAGCRVLAKFLCVKAIVFATFWQGVIIAGGIQLGVLQRVIKPHGHDTEEDLATRLQNWIVCIEMTFFALAHSYAFSAREFWAVENGPPPRNVFANMKALLDWRDVGANMVGQVSYGADTLAEGMSTGATAVLAPLRKFQQTRRARAHSAAMYGDADIFGDATLFTHAAARASDRGSRQGLLQPNEQQNSPRV